MLLVIIIRLFIIKYKKIQNSINFKITSLYISTITFHAKETYIYITLTFIYISEYIYINITESADSRYIFQHIFIMYMTNYLLFINNIFIFFAIERENI